MTNTTLEAVNRKSFPLVQADVLRLIYIINFFIKLLNCKIKINKSY
jgi:hypothetical protein